MLRISSGLCKVGIRPRPDGKCIGPINFNLFIKYFGNQSLLTTYDMISVYNIHVLYIAYMDMM